MTSSLGLDTSIVLRLLTGEPDKEFSRAKTFLNEAFEKDAKLLVSDMVIAETYFSLHYHYNVPKKEIISRLYEFLSSGTVTALPGSVCKQVLETAMHSSTKPGFVDRILHKQFLNHCDGVVSFDKAMGKLPNTKIL